jgi:hypothetical protein
VLYKQTQFRSVGRDRGASCVKRTQFPTGKLPRDATVPSFHRSRPESFVQNKANCPRMSGNGRGPAGPERAPAGSIVRNKPNFRSRASDGKCSMGKWLWQIRPAGPCEKTKPIPAGRGIPLSTIPSFQYSRPEPFVRNKAKRQWAVVGSQWPVGRPIVRNKANSPAGPGGRRNRSCETKPISAVGRGPGGRNVRNEPNLPVDCAKRTQFPARVERW